MWRMTDHTKHSTLTLVSLNLLDDLDLWDQRGPLVVRELDRLQPDIIAFQEVRMSINNAQWIADQLGGYEVFLCPKTGERGRHDALALLSRLPVKEHHKFSLGHQDRVALRIVVEHQGATWHMATTHTYWHPLDDRTRLQEAKRLVDWLPAPGVICGDFNAEPNYPSMLKMKERFQSAHVAANGHEPDLHLSHAAVSRGGHAQYRAAHQPATRRTGYQGQIGILDGRDRFHLCRSGDPRSKNAMSPLTIRRGTTIASIPPIIWACTRSCSKW